MFKFKELFSEGWYDLVLGRAMWNMSPLFSDWGVISGGCTSFGCGQAVGDATHRMLGWGI